MISLLFLILTGEIAEHLLRPMQVALPGLALVLVVAVGFSLRPLRRLTDDLATRAPNRLTPIASTDTPREIAPLIGRLNELFAGIDRALQNERRFTADASHELRTPLAALKAQAQVALAATDETTRRHALGQILLGCDRGTHLVTQMLTLARLDADSGQAMHEIDLRPLAEAVLAATAGEAIANGCELALADGNARVRGNAALLQSLLRNLIDNALRHGGARQIEIAIAQAGKDVVLTITDDGRGIPASEREIVTQRFRRGTGAAEKVYSKFQEVIKSIEIELPKGLENYPSLHEIILEESKSLTTNQNICKSDFELGANNISLLYYLTRISCLEHKILAFKNKAIEFCEDQALGRIVEDYYSYNAILTITSERLMPNEKFEIYAGIGCFEKAEITGCSVFKKPVPIENGMATYKGRASSFVGEKTIPVEIYRRNHKGEIDTLRNNVIYRVVDTICSHQFSPIIRCRHHRR